VGLTHYHARDLVVPAQSPIRLRGAKMDGVSEVL